MPLVWSFWSRSKANLPHERHHEFGALVRHLWWRLHSGWVRKIIRSKTFKNWFFKSHFDRLESSQKLLWQHHSTFKSKWWSSLVYVNSRCGVFHTNPKVNSRKRWKDSRDKHWEHRNPWRRQCALHDRWDFLNPDFKLETTMYSQIQEIFSKACSTTSAWNGRGDLEFSKRISRV